MILSTRILVSFALLALTACAPTAATGDEAFCSSLDTLEPDLTAITDAIDALPSSIDADAMHEWAETISAVLPAARTHVDAAVALTEGAEAKAALSALGDMTLEIAQAMADDARNSESIVDMQLAFLERTDLVTRSSEFDWEGLAATMDEYSAARCPS